MYGDLGFSLHTSQLVCIVQNPYSKALEKYFNPKHSIEYMQKSLYGMTITNCTLQSDIPGIMGYSNIGRFSYTKLQFILIVFLRSFRACSCKVFTF